VRITAHDTVPVPGARVVLHRVGRAVQGPIDSALAGSHGEFRFRFRPDTTAIYLLSSGWNGIEYFSTPLHTNPELPDSGLIIAVSDTSSAARVLTVSRHLVVSKPGRDGRRSALEIVVLTNPGFTTRVSPDSIHPGWTGGLPPGVVNFQPGSGDFSGEALVVRHDSVMLFAPIAPGEKQLIYTYSLPPGPGRVRIPALDSIATANVLLEEFDRTVKGGGIVKADSEKIEGRSFRQWVGPVPAGGVVEIDFPAIGGTRWLLPALVGTLALVLGAVALKVLSGTRGGVPPKSPALIDRLARLDRQYAGKEASTPPEEWQRYQAERARLKAEVAAQFGRSRQTP
jgi:hypothetical protein